MNWHITEQLPARQASTLKGLCEGKTTKEMAKDAGVSSAVINDAVRALAHRLRLHTAKRALIVAEASARGWARTVIAVLLVAMINQLATSNAPDMRPTPRPVARTRTASGRSGRTNNLGLTNWSINQ